MAAALFSLPEEPQSEAHRAERLRMPRIAKKDMAELPKPVIKPGSLGFSPLNTLSLSYIAQGHGNAILGYVEDPRNAVYKEHPTLTLKAGKSSTSYSLVGVFFTGLADALYRGKLPQVVIATPNPTELKAFLNEFLDYVEKMVTLGFTLGKSNPVDDLVPCFVIASTGVFFSSFLTQLSRNLENTPDIDARMRAHILGRFCRGFIVCPENDTHATQPVGRQVELVTDLTRRIKIAGGDERTQAIVQQVLSAHQLVTVIENSVQNPAERLEFENALWRTSGVILPTLKAEKVFSARQTKELQGKLNETILEIGKKRHAFEELDDLDSITGRSPYPKAAKSAGPTAESLSLGDAAILGGLKLYADLLNLNTETRQMLDMLSRTVFEKIGAEKIENLQA